MALTSHGFGHATMTAPVIKALAARLPGLRLTIRSSHPARLLDDLFDLPHERIEGPEDFGLRMLSARQIDLAASAQSYRRLHEDLEDRVAALATVLVERRVDLVLSNAGYLALLAARRAGVPALALSCLNWADIYAHYFHALPEGPGIEETMLEGYASAWAFLGCTPAMPMERLSNFRPIGPIARIARLQREHARRRMEIEPGTRLGLVAFGGIETDLPLADLPHVAGWRWIVKGETGGRSDLIPLSEIGLSFTDMLVGCDILVAKPGYGTFTEAAVNGVPALFLPRHDWPESDGLISWLAIHGRCRAIEEEELFDPVLLQGRIDPLLVQPLKPLVLPTGIEDAVDILAAALD